MNSVSIIGNLTKDLELKYTSSGKAVALISIAVNKSYTSNGEKVQEVSYFQVEIWGATAENCQKYIGKGSKIAVVGELKQDRWDKDGQTQSRIKIVANRVEFLTPKKDGDKQQQTTQQPPSSQQTDQPDQQAWTE